MRLEKFLAHAGVASRRAAKEIIRAGHVTVNGRIVREPGIAVDETQDDIRLNGSRVRLTRRYRYIIINKPRGFVSSARDPEGRRTVLDLLPPMGERLYPVGRLDVDAEGLVLMTNDGELAHRLMHPRYEVGKTYVVTVKGEATEEAVQRLRSGVWIEGGRTAPAQVSVLHRTESESRLKLVLHEGRKHQVKLMCRAVGLPVKRLRRVAIGPITVHKLPKGAHRELSRVEVAALRSAVRLPADEATRPRDRQPRRTKRRER